MHFMPGDSVDALPPGTGFVQLTVEVQEPTLAFLLGSKSVVSNPPVTVS